MYVTYRTRPAYATSVFLHGSIVAVVLGFVTWRALTKPDEPEPIFELVAGEGDNYGATEAPALGTPGGIKVEVPEIPRPTPAPVAATPEPEPVITPAPPQPTPAPPPKAAAAIVSPPIPNMARNIERLADKREANIRKKVEQEQKVAQKKAEEAAKRLSKEEFDRQNANKKTGSSTAKAPSGPISTKRIDAEGIAKGVVGGSTSNRQGGAGGTALSRAEADLIDAYAALIIQRIRRALESTSFNDLAEVKVQFQVSASGAISNARIVTSSGNAEFDQAILNAFRTIVPVGPPPTKRAETFVVPIRLRER